MEENSNPSKMKHLLMITRHERIEYKGICEIIINFGSYYLTVSPQTEDLKPNDVIVSFESLYILHKHILCVFDKDKKCNIALVFHNEAVCEKVHNYISKNNPKLSSEESKKKFYNKFLTPLCKTINDTLNPEMFFKEILKDFWNAYEGNEKDAFLKYLKRRKVEDFVFAKEEPQSVEETENPAPQNDNERNENGHVINENYLNGSTSELSSSNATSPTPLPSTTTMPFYKKEIKVHGNLNNFFKNHTSAVISPFGIDYILSFIGNVGGPKEKAAINEYFGTTHLGDLYYYYNAAKKSIFDKKGTNNFMISNFITGNETKEFMNELTTFDGVSVYPASDYLYSDYFNDMLGKRSQVWSRNKIPFFSKKNFITPVNTAVGFSHIKLELQFKQIENKTNRHEKFYGNDGKERYVSLFVTNSYQADFDIYRLHQIKFTNPSFDMFIAENLKDNSIPFIEPNEILRNLKSMAIGKIKTSYSSICVPTIQSQNTIDILPYLEKFLNQTLAIYSPFNETIPGKDKYDLKNFYQALRFDVSGEGLNRPMTRDYPSGISNNEYIINKPFMYGIVFKTEVLIYYGVYA